MKKEFSIGFLTSTDPHDKISWSGAHYRMFESLERDFKVVPLGPIKMNRIIRKLNYWIDKISVFLFKKHYNLKHNILSSLYYSYKLGKKVKRSKIDVIFAPASATEMAFLKTNIPICYMSDSSFLQINEYYNDYSNILKLSIKESSLIERKAIERASTLIYPSAWAANFVKENYKTENKGVHIIPMGANIDQAPNLNDLEFKLKNKSKCNILLLGIDWERKGGIIAFETLLELEKRGINPILTVCGCIPPESIQHPNLKVIPNLNKNIESEYKEFINILSETHFLLLPTKAECFGIVFCEASAFGIPSITFDTGGLANSVENNVNGYRLPIDAKAEEFAKVIFDIFTNESEYEKLVYSSRQKFDKELNWNAWGNSVKHAMQDIVNINSSR